MFSLILLVFYSIPIFSQLSFNDCQRFCYIRSAKRYCDRQNLASTSSSELDKNYTHVECG